MLRFQTKYTGTDVCQETIFTGFIFCFANFMEENFIL